jgi:hypothetical protein
VFGVKEYFLDRDTLAAAYLALVWGVVCVIMIFIEPGMGFEVPQDFFDPIKVAAGYESSFAWRFSNLLLIALPLALVVLIAKSNDRFLVWSGLFSALLVLIFGCLDAVGFQLRALLPTDEAVYSALASLLPIRFAI